MDITFCSVAGTTITLQVLDYTTLADVSKKIAKKINGIAESIVFSYNGKTLPRSLPVSQIPIAEGDFIMFQNAINLKPGENIRFAFEDINDTVELIAAQKMLFCSKDIIKASKAIYSKEHLNPAEKRKSDPDSFPEMLESLKQLGYNEVRCANALRRADFSIEIAGSILMDNQEGIQEILEIIEIMEQMSDVSLDNQIISIEKKKANVPKSSLARPAHAPPKPIIQPSTPNKGRGTKLSESALIKKPLAPIDGTKKAPKLLAPPKQNPQVVVPKTQNVMRQSLPPLRI